MDKETLHSICLPPSATIKDAIQRLNQTAKKILCVTDREGRLLGTISDGDVRRALLKGYGFDEPVERIMAKEYRAISSSEESAGSVKERAKALMKDHKLAHIPLLDERQRIIDVVAWTDFLDNGEEISSPSPMRENLVIIMAGGKGTRLNPFTEIFPKPLVPLGDKPAVEIIMERFARCGFHRFLYTLNYKKEYMKLFLKERAFPYEIDWVEEDAFLGTAGSLAMLKGKVYDSFFVANCDTLLSVDFGEVLTWHKEHNAALTIIGSHNEVNIPFGVLTMVGGRLEGIREKPVHDVIINTGMYVMEPLALDYITPGQPLDMNDLIGTIAAREKVSVYSVYGRDWIDLGQWEEYKKGIQYLQE